MVYYHHTDHLGTTEVITDSNGKIVWHADYEAFGSVMNESGKENFTPNYTGKFFDESSGLYYFNARWYDCELGRFTTQDPARDGVNWYGYCSNNPLIYTDPDGREVVGILLFSIATTYVVNNMPSKEEHYNRNDNQSQFSFARVEDAVRAGFTQLGTATGEEPEGLDNCHENGLGIPNPSGNNKYTMPDGKGGSYELIYDSNGNLVTDDVNKGTYNYADPKGLKGKLNHGVKDLLPYLIFGNSKDDPTTFGERLMGTINSPVGKYDRDVNLTRKEVNQIKAQEQQRAKEAALERYNAHH